MPLSGRIVDPKSIYISYQSVSYLLVTQIELSAAHHILTARCFPCDSVPTPL